jgi:chemotaxis family two-component system sensor kinase Cph1
MPVDNCKTAELQFIDRVQSFGALVAVDKRTKCICACSANTEEFTGKRPDELLGQDWRALFQADQLPTLFMAADIGGQHFPHIQRAELNGRDAMLASHSVGDRTLVEIEAYRAEPEQFEFAGRIGYLHALAETATAEDAAGVLMNSLAQILQFDRVMLYKFLPDWHGEVIAERLKAGLHGYLGLRFPASDLPANARRLYMVNYQRLIADVNADTPTVATTDHKRIDLTYSQLRSVHPVHIQYLKNMGVEASFSVSVVAAGKLWGLVACHHLTPKNLSLAIRQRCEEAARITGLHMSGLGALRLAERRAGFRESFAEILGALKSENGTKRAMVHQLAKIRDIFLARGILAHLDDEDFHAGVIPDDISLSALRNWLENYDRSSVAASRTISPALATHPALVRFASGTLYIPLSGQDYLLLMRPEQVESVNWAGKPQGLSGAADDSADLSPRASFQTWSEQVKGASEPWEDVEVEAGQRFREMLIGYLETLQLASAALRDPLTGLANRLMFERALQEAIKLAIKNDSMAAVIIMDLDNFKLVNDTLGHSAGDELLIEVGKRVTGLLRARDVVARLGGDEFGIVQFDVKETADADRTAERVLLEMRRPFLLKGQSIEIGASIGYSMCPIHAIEHGELVEDADLALYQAKRAGRNTFKSFTSGMLSDNVHRESARQELIDAMRGQAMSLVYQPIVSSKEKILRSFEAFARWEHPEKGTLAARDFLPLIEHSHLTAQFAEWGIREVLQQAKLWTRNALPLAPVSLNLSARQFFSLDLAGLCSTLSREYDIGLEWLRFDLEETALQVDLPRAAQKIFGLSQLGVLTNVDHFGQGLVPLNRLVDVKINKLKMAGTHFEGGKNLKKNDALIAIIREVGRVLHVPIVATQIDSETMERRATTAGIEYLQGYHICRPLEAAIAEDWLRARISRDS